MKIALCLDEYASAASARARAMIEAHRHEADCAQRVLDFGFGSLALLGRPAESPDAWPLWSHENGSFLAFAGLPLAASGSTRGPVRADDRLVSDALAGSDAAATLAGLTALDGAFVAVWWSAPTGRLVVATDFLGMQPLYRGDVGGSPAFASEAKSFVRAGVLPAERDAGAWGAMLFFGHQIGPRSLLAGVRRVGAAELMLFDGAGREQRRASWSWPRREDRPDSEALRQEIGDAVRADVVGYAAAYPDASILLSGGFDSRLILCLCREIGLRPRAIVQSHPDENADADARFATALARSLALDVRHVSATRDFFSSTAYLRFLERNEIATPSLGLFIANVGEVVRAERAGVWEGLLLDPALKFDYGEGGFAPYLDARRRARRDYRDAAKLVFDARWVERMESEFDELVEAERSRFDDDADGVWRFSVLNRSRFRTGVNPYQVYDTVTAPLTPGMSKDFWETVARVDPRARFGKALYRAVFERLAPDGLRTPLASGSTLVPGTDGAALYHTQRARAAIQRVAQRPRVTRWLRSAGLPTPFAWARSDFLDVALREAPDDDTRLNADWLRSRRRGASAGRLDDLALEMLLYWVAWERVMRGDLAGAWGTAGARPR